MHIPDTLHCGQLSRNACSLPPAAFEEKKKRAARLHGAQRPDDVEDRPRAVEAWDAAQGERQSLREKGNVCTCKESIHYD